MTTQQENGHRYAVNIDDLINGVAFNNYTLNNNYILGNFSFYWSKTDFVKSSVCCQTCFKILSGTSLLLHSSENVYSYDYTKCTDPHLNVYVNKQLIHNLIINIKNCKNPFENFDELFNKYFSISAPNMVKLRQFRFYERIFLRTLAMELGMKSLEKSKEVIKLSQLSKIMSSSSGKTGGASYLVHATSSSQFNEDVSFKGDLPSDFSKVAFSGDTDFDNFSQLMFYIFINKSKLINNSMLKLQLMIMSSFCLGRIDNLLLKTSASPLFLVGRRNIVSVYLNSARNFLLEFRAENKFDNQRVQIYELLGLPGLGKSRSVVNFCELISGLVPSLQKVDLFYTRVNDKFWNGYYGQPVLLYDDIGHRNVKLARYDAIQELIEIASGVMLKPPMAFEKDTRFTSCMCFITSNAPLVDSVKNESTRGALKRRIITVELEPHFNCATFSASLGYYEYNFKGNFISTLITKENRSILSFWSSVLSIYELNDKELEDDYDDLDFNGNIEEEYENFETINANNLLTVCKSMFDDRELIICDFMKVVDLSNHVEIFRQLYTSCFTALRRDLGLIHQIMKHIIIKFKISKEMLEQFTGDAGLYDLIFR